MSGFTKGKWKYSEELQQVTAYPEGPGNWPVVGGMPAFPGEAPSLWKDITGELCWNGDETDANGRLIAAAPEMYALLELFSAPGLIVAADERVIKAREQAQALLARIDGKEEAEA